MKITRSRPQTDFVIIPNAAAGDRRLSWKARGLLVYLLSRPDGWSTDSESLADRGPDGRTAVRTGLLELEHAGYLVRTRVQGDRGRWRTESAVYDEPQPQLDFELPQVAPKTGSPTSEEPAAGGPAAGRPAVGAPVAKRQDGEQDGGGARAPRGRPTPSPDATHGGRHPAGNPLDVGCRRCAEEKVAAAAAAVEAQRQRERDAVAATRAARAAELAAGTSVPPVDVRAIAEAERAARAAQRSVLLSDPAAGATG